MKEIKFKTNINCNNCVRAVSGFLDEVVGFSHNQAVFFLRVVFFYPFHHQVGHHWNQTLIFLDCLLHFWIVEFFNQIEVFPAAVGGLHRDKVVYRQSLLWNS